MTRQRSYQPGKPRYNCDVAGCDSSFSRSEHLKRHKLCHDRSISHKCPFCSHSFLRKDILKRHMKRQHENNGSIASIDSATTSATDDQLKASNTDDQLSHELHSGTLEINQLDVVTAQIQSPSLNSTPIGHFAQSEEVYKSPTAILGNSSQAVSQLLNEDFVSWLFNCYSEESTNHSVAFYSKMPTSSFQTIPENLSSTAGESHVTHDISEAVSHWTGRNEERSIECSSSTCEKLRNFIDLPQDPLSNKYIVPEFISKAIQTYWSLHLRWPILHKPSFDINETPAPLLIAMISLAMHIMDEPDIKTLAVTIHHTFRFKVYALDEFRSPAELWVFQALLLAEIFEKMASTTAQHDMASIFHDVLIASMRKGGTMGRPLEVNSSELAAQDADENAQWNAFIMDEARKRIAFFAFVVDSQHAAFFDQTPSVLISDLQGRLPCEESLWEAENASIWRERKDLTPLSHHFLSTITLFLSMDSPQISLTPWNMMLVLHGIMSVAWTMNLRHATVASDVTEKDKSLNKGNLRWSRILSASCYEWLRQYRQAFIVSGRLPYNHPYILGCLSIYELTHVALNANTSEIHSFIQILALDSYRLDKKWQAFGGLLKSLIEWVNSPRSRESMVHALDLLDLFHMTGDRLYDVRSDTGLHRPWCLYVASITLWTFQYLSYCYSLSVNGPANTKTLPRMKLNQILTRIRMGLSTNTSIADRVSDYTIGSESLNQLQITITDHQMIGNFSGNIILESTLNVLQPSGWGLCK